MLNLSYLAGWVGANFFRRGIHRQTSSGASSAGLPVVLDADGLLDSSFYAISDTWTPGLTLGGGSTGMTLSAGGTYVKIGPLVYITGGITVTTEGSSTGNAVITGLPFARTSGGSMPVRYAGMATNWITVMAIASGSTLLLRGATAAGTNNTGTNLTNADIQNGTVLDFNGWYIA